MTQYVSIISKFRLFMAISYVYACASVPTCTSIIKLSNYQFSLSTHYHIRTISQQPIHMSNCHKAVTSRYDEKETCCSRTTSSLQQRASTIRVTNPSQLVAARTTLTAMSAPYLKQSNHNFQNTFCYSPSEPPRCSEINSHYSKRR